MGSDPQHMPSIHETFYLPLTIHHLQPNPTSNSRPVTKSVRTPPQQRSRLFNKSFKEDESSDSVVCIHQLDENLRDATRWIASLRLRECGMVCWWGKYIGRWLSRECPWRFHFFGLLFEFTFSFIIVKLQFYLILICSLRLSTSTAISKFEHVLLLRKRKHLLFKWKRKSTETQVEITRTSLLLGTGYVG